MSELTKKVREQHLIDNLISLKREAFGYLDEALSIDSTTDKKSQKDNAIFLYEKSIGIIDRALNYYESNKTKLETDEDAVKISTQLNRMKAQANERLDYLKLLKNNEEFLDLGDQILENEYDFVTVDENDTSNNENKKEESSTNNNQTNFSKASELLNIENGAQIYYIANDGTVSTPSYPTTLTIYSFDKETRNSYEKNQSKNIVAFIKVGTWVYPLIPNESPIMKTTFDSYIFPNENNEESNNMPISTFIGITFPANINAEQKIFFEDVLSNYGALIYQNQEANDTKRPLIPSTSASTITPSNSSNEPLSKQFKSDKEKEKQSDSSITSESSAEYISKQILSGAEYLSKGVEKTTEYANKYINKSGEQMKAKLEPNPQPTNVDPTVQNLLKNVRYGTHVSVRVSSYLVNKLGSIATATAKKVAPHIKSGSKALLSKSGLASNEKTANNYVENACMVASSSIQGFAILYDSLEQAAKTLAKNVSEQTVNVVDYKYDIFFLIFIINMVFYFILSKIRT
jgi:spartin